MLDFVTSKKNLSCFVPFAFDVTVTLSTLMNFNYFAVNNSFACTVPDANLMIANVYTSIYNKIDIDSYRRLYRRLDVTSLALAQRHTCDHAIRYKISPLVPKFFNGIYYVYQFDSKTLARIIMRLTRQLRATRLRAEIRMVMIKNGFRAKSLRASKHTSL